MSNPEAIGDSIDTLEGVLETLDGTAKDVFRLVMVDHVGTGSSTLLAHVFVGLSTDLKVCGCLTRVVWIETTTGG